jgi:hypothetical protein
MSSPGSGSNHYFSGSPVTPHGQFLLYLISCFEVRDICCDLSNYLNFIRWYGNIAHCKLDVTLNTIQFCVEQKFSQSPSATHMSRGFCLAIPGPTEETVSEWNLSNQNCTHNLILTWRADFIDFLNKPEQVELLKSASKNKKYRWK